MFSKNVIIQHSDDVMLILFIAVIKQLEYFKFNSCLMLKPFLIPDNFACYNLLIFMIEAFQSLPEWPTSQLVNDFIPVPYMVIHNYVIVASLIVKSKVQRLTARRLNLGWLGSADKVHLGKRNNFGFFILRQYRVEMRKCLSPGHREIDNDPNLGAGLLRVW
jgi:hypothetical protein